MLKTYETFDSISVIEQVICEEVIMNGASHGWEGSVENFVLLQEKLSQKGRKQ